LPTKTGLRTLICFHSDIFSSDKTAEQWKNARGNRDTPSFRQRFWRKGDRKKDDIRRQKQSRLSALGNQDMLAACEMESEDTSQDVLSAETPD